MRILIRSRGLTLNATMRDYLKKEVHRVMGKWQRRISSVYVFFAALKDAAGGLGCRMVVTLHRSDRNVVVTEKCPNFYALTDRVVRRAGFALRRRLQRKYARRRRRGRESLAAANLATV